MAATERRLQKSRTDRMIDGVCGGIAAYFGIDATLIRVLWVLLTLFGGSGVILYIVAMIIMPKEDAPVPVPVAAAAAEPAVAGSAAEPGPATPPPVSPAAPKNHAGNTKFWGILLVAVGAFWLVSNLGVSLCFGLFGFPWHIGIPVLFILAGVAFLFGGRSYVSAQPSPYSGTEQAGASTEPGPAAPSMAGVSSRLYRSRQDKKIMGVCGGIAAHVHIDPVIVRLLFVAGALVSHGLFIILYFLLGIVIPKEPVATPAA
jgi:phage shock protein C